MDDSQDDPVIPGSNFLLNLHWIGLLTFWIAIILTIVSGIQYLLWYLWITSQDGPA